MLIHVTTPARSGRVPPHPVRLHRVGTLRAREVTAHDGVPVTTVSRTLLDRAGRLGPRHLKDAIAQADRLGRFDLGDLSRVLGAHRRQPGRRKLIGLLDRLAGVGAADLRSHAERVLLELCDRHGLPQPVANAQVAGFLVDFTWPGTDLIVEVDGFTYHQLTRERQRTAARLRQLLVDSRSL